MQTKQKSYKGLIYILLVLLSLFMLVPFYWMVISSLKLNKDVFSIPMKWWPDSITRLSGKSFRLRPSS